MVSSKCSASLNDRTISRRISLSGSYKVTPGRWLNSLTNLWERWLIFSRDKLIPLLLLCEFSRKKENLSLSGTTHRFSSSYSSLNPAFGRPLQRASFSAEQPVIRGRSRSHASRCLCVRDQETLCASHL